MRNKLFYLLFVLCLIKLYDIADRSLNFSTDLLQKSFKQGAGEKNSFIDKKMITNDYKKKIKRLRRRRKPL